jgi:hypothetical protein
MKRDIIKERKQYAKSKKMREGRYVKLNYNLRDAHVAEDACKQNSPF